jgi:hypothetical protein
MAVLADTIAISFGFSYAMVNHLPPYGFFFVIRFEQHSFRYENELRSVNMPERSTSMSAPARYYSSTSYAPTVSSFSVSMKMLFHFM